MIFDTRGGSLIDDLMGVQAGSKITRPTDPTREGYAFTGWVTSDGDEWNFETDLVDGDITLMAQWTRL